MIEVFFAIVAWFLASILLGVGYMIWDMRKRKTPTWTSSTTFSDPEDHSGGGGVAR